MNSRKRFPKTVVAKAACSVQEANGSGHPDAANYALEKEASFRPGANTRFGCTLIQMTRSRLANGIESGVGAH